MNPISRIVSFAQTLAHAGFTVLVSEMAGFRDLRIHPRDAREVANVVGKERPDE